MKIGLYTDVHYCSTSSIIRSRGNKFSTRIENCINSINWAEDMFKALGCEQIVCLGDFFDKNTLTAEEIRGLNDIKFADTIHHTFLVGNHEISKADCTTSSMHVFNAYPFIDVIDTPRTMLVDNIQLCFLPYTIEENRKPLGSLFGCKGSTRIIFSHNDIKGIRYGAYVSELGYDLEDIKANADMFINGHLHNGQFLNDQETILNLGNLTGQNFSEDATKYSHYICILDTDTMELSFYENPYAFNFYKLRLDETLPRLKSNAVVSLTRKDNQDQQAELFLNDPCIVASRVMIEPSDDNEVVVTKDDLIKIDHLKLFDKFVQEKLGTTQLVKDELQKILEVNA